MLCCKEVYNDFNKIDEKMFRFLAKQSYKCKVLSGFDLTWAQKCFNCIFL